MKRSRLLVVLCLLVIIGLRLIAVIRRNMSRANVESSQLGRSQRAVGVRDGQEDRDVRELLERLIPLAVNNLLVVLHNLKALIHHIHALISASACGKDTPEHLQDAGVGSRSKGGTTTASSCHTPALKSTEPKPPYVCPGCLITRIATI
jgi:hypothetical protein